MLETSATSDGAIGACGRRSKSINARDLRACVEMIWIASSLPHYKPSHIYYFHRQLSQDD